MRSYVVNLAHLLPMGFRPHTSIFRPAAPKFYWHIHRSSPQLRGQTVFLKARKSGKSGGIAHDIIAAAGAAVAKAAPLFSAFLHSRSSGTSAGTGLIVDHAFDSFSGVNASLYGVGVHHMGTVYLSKSRTTRKFSSGRVWRASSSTMSCARAGEATLVAEMRERSEREDYIEHERCAEAKRSASFLILFSARVRSHPRSRSTLPDAVYQILTSSTFLVAGDKRNSFTCLNCSWPQYHIGILFPIVEQYQAFQHDVNSSQWPEPAHMVPYVGFLDVLAESFLGADLPDEAVRLFRLDCHCSGAVELHLSQVIQIDSFDQLQASPGTVQVTTRKQSRLSRQTCRSVPDIRL